MQRLTFVKCQKYWAKGRHPTKYSSRKTFQEVVDRLAYYEDMEEQGRLVVLSCKVVCGIDIWWADSTIHTKPVKCEVCSFGVYSGFDGRPQVWMNCYVYGPNGESRSIRVSDIGKTVFLTREEAEDALKGGAE